jgi:polar amino acid transport system substrate-binding protein
MNNRQVVVTLKGNKISAIADLKDKTVALQKGSTAVDALDAPENAAVKASIKDGEPVTVENNVLAMYELRQGTSDAVIMDEIVARYYIAHLTELETEASAA